MSKLKRSALLHYINAKFSDSLQSWFIIGKDVEDLSVEMNADTETVKNILDENNVNDNGYEPSFDVDTYYADPDDGEFYERVKNITMNRLTGDACKTQILEVLIDRTDSPFDAWIENVIVKPQSYGGAQGGVKIPYSVSFSGGRRQVKVTIDEDTKAVSIVENLNGDD